MICSHPLTSCAFPFYLSKFFRTSLPPMLLFFSLPIMLLLHFLTAHAFFTLPYLSRFFHTFFTFHASFSRPYLSRFYAASILDPASFTLLLASALIVTLPPYPRCAVLADIWVPLNSLLCLKLMHSKDVLLGFWCRDLSD